MSKPDYISILNDIREFEVSMGAKYGHRVELALVSVGKGSLSAMVGVVDEVYHERISLFPREGIRDRGRNKKLVMMRYIYFYLAREMSGKSLADIGFEVGFNHASVIHGCKSVNVKINVEKDFAYTKYLNIVKEKLNEKGSV